MQADRARQVRRSSNTRQGNENRQIFVRRTEQSSREEEKERTALFRLGAVAGLSPVSGSHPPGGAGSSIILGAAHVVHMHCLAASGGLGAHLARNQWPAGGRWQACSRDKPVVQAGEAIVETSAYWPVSRRLILRLS